MENNQVISKNIFDNNHGYQLKNGSFKKAVNNSDINRIPEEVYFKNLKTIRNLSISVIVFTSLWIFFIVMGICFALFQVGFSDKFEYVKVINVLDKEIYVKTGIDFTTHYRIFSSLTLTPEQEYWYGFYNRLWISIVVIAFVMFIIDNILLYKVKKLVYGSNYPKNQFLNSVLSVLFKLTGIILILSAFEIIFDFFGNFDEGWALLIAFSLFIFIAAIVIGIAIITNTVLSLCVSSCMIHKYRKQTSTLNFQ